MEHLSERMKFSINLDYEGGIPRSG